MGLPGFKRIPTDVAKEWHSDEEPPYLKQVIAAQRYLNFKRYSRDLVTMLVGVGFGYWLVLEFYVVALVALAIGAVTFAVLAFRNYMVSRMAAQEADQKIKIIPESELEPENDQVFGKSA